MGGQEMKGVYLNYDAENDVLYFYFAKPQEAISFEIAEGVFLRLDPHTDEVVGFTVLDLSKKSLEARGIQIIPTDKTPIKTGT